MNFINYEKKMDLGSRTLEKANLLLKSIGARQINRTGIFDFSFDIFLYLYLFLLILIKIR